CHRAVGGKDTPAVSSRSTVPQTDGTQVRRGRSDRDLPHPIFARVVLSENPAGLLGKSLVTGRRRLGATSLRLRPIRSRALFSRYVHYRGSKLWGPRFH